MKKSYLLLFLIPFSGKLFSQEVYELHLTSDFRFTNNQNYSYARLLKQYNGLWAFTDYDRKNNNKVQTGFFTDSSLAYQTGHNKFYDNNKLVYEGNFENGLRTGWWYFYDKHGSLSDSLYYSVPATKTITTPPAKDFLAEHEKKDTSALVKNVEIEAEYPGGTKNWTKYLTKTLNYPDLVLKVSPPGHFRSVIQFVVCTDGSVCNVSCINSTHPLLDLEAVKAIRKGANWVPAEQNGRKVKAYRIQPIIFGIEN